MDWPTWVVSLGFWLFAAWCVVAWWRHDIRQERNQTMDRHPAGKRRRDRW
jgi:hypothetical protein